MQRVYADLHRSITAGQTTDAAPRRWERFDGAAVDAAEAAFTKFADHCFSERLFNHLPVVNAHLDIRFARQANAPGSNAEAIRWEGSERSRRPRCWAQWFVPHGPGRAGRFRTDAATSFLADESNSRHPTLFLSFNLHLY